MALLTLPKALAAAARGGGGYEYLAENGQPASKQPFSQLLDDALLVAGGLREAGLQPGETIALIVPDAREFLTTFLGAACAGLVPAPLYPPVRLDQFEAYLRQTLPAVRVSQAAAVVTTTSLRRVLGAFQANVPSVRSVLAIEKLAGPRLDAAARVGLDDPAFLQFTSGSTSDPKGVVLTHRNLAENVTAIAGPHGLRLTASDRGVSWLPLFHDMGLIGMALTVLYAGCWTEFLSPLAFLKRPALWLKALTRLQGTISFAPNFAYDLCVRRVQPHEMEGLDLSSWRVAGCGAEPVRAETLAAFAKKFAGVGFRAESFLPCYGMAEHTLAVTFPRLDRVPRVDVIDAGQLSTARRAVPPQSSEALKVELVSCGRPFPGHDVRIADPRGHALAERHVGQILLKGPSVFRGYLDREALTRETLAGGWLHSGDLGYLAGGELYVCGRVKDTIIVNGRNYYPQDLEQAAADVPDVRRGRAVAFGIDAGAGRERIVVVVEPAHAAHGDDLADRVRGRIAEATGVLVDEVVVAPAGTIPKTTSGKLQRSRIRHRYESGVLLRPRDVTSRVRLIGHVVRTQLVYARAHATGVIKGWTGGGKTPAFRRGGRPEPR
jgi:acyl-CoA synthetase (AMP-forming)/AMP-acid ligase II